MWLDAGSKCDDSEANCRLVFTFDLFSFLSKDQHYLLRIAILPDYHPVYCYCLSTNIARVSIVLLSTPAIALDAVYVLNKS